MASNSMQPPLSETISSNLARPSLLFAMIMLIYGFNSAVGTTLYASSWYYIVPAISWVDVIIFCNFLILLFDKRHTMVIATSRIEKRQVQLLFTLSALLIMSVSVNAFRFNTSLADLLPGLRLLYFITMVHVIKKYSDRFGARYLIIGFLSGVAAVAVQSYSKVQFYLWPGVPVLWDPNVTGALLGLGVFFAALLVLYKQNILISLIAAMGFCAVSMLTWSKGSWLMCGTSALILSMFLLNYPKTHRRGKMITSKLRLLFVVLFFVALISLFVVNIEIISVILERKLASTTNINSIEIRFKLIIAAIVAGFDNPIFGLGYRNFFHVYEYAPYRELLDPNQLTSWNAHNIFFQILAVAGIPAFLVLLAQFIAPFTALRRILSKFYSSGFRRYLVILFILIVWFVYGSIQLQLIAQPPFWFFCGIVFSLHQKVSKEADLRFIAKRINNTCLPTEQDR